jgi:hypothetical protein
MINFRKKNMRGYINGLSNQKKKMNSVIYFLAYVCSIFLQITSKKKNKRI